MVQNIGLIVLVSNFFAPSPILGTIFNTNQPKNWLNLVASVKILSGLDRNYEFNCLRSKYSQIKPKKKKKFPFKSQQKATKAEKSLISMRNSLKNKIFFKTHNHEG